MFSVDDNFNELLSRIDRGREVVHASFEPIYYLIFEPSDILAVKRKLQQNWKVKLKKDGWNVYCFSIAETIKQIWKDDPCRQLWLLSDSSDYQEVRDTSTTLTNALENGTLIQKALESLLSSLEGENKPIVLVTDLEALHPYLRIGAIESQLQGKFSVPTVFFYPGTREGKTSLRFLGFYPPDGNYRSVHVGG
jgi:Domain of unknown function (DUF1788)